jgi:hypothetical protein
MARTRFADPDAGWGHRSYISIRKGGAYYGYKIHASVCTATELPLAWTVEAANEPEQEQVLGLLDATLARGFAPAQVCSTRATTGSRCTMRASPVASGP